MVALRTLWGLFEPRVLVRISWTPAASSTGRTAPPAMTPVPGTAGLRKTRPAPKWPVISHGMVVSRRGTKTRSFFACSTAFRIASGTSWALPRPTPTWPRPSPTTTRAVKENLRPPLTTLATRLMDTTRSFSSSTLGSIFASATSSLPSSSRQSSPPPPLGRGRADALPGEPSELESARPGSVGQRLDPAVVFVAAAIEHHARDPTRLGLLGQESSYGLGRADVAAGPVLALEAFAPAVDGQESLGRLVVDDLGVDVVEATEHDQPRPGRRTTHPSPQAPVPLVARRPPIPRDHFAPAFLPTLRRTTSPA